MKENGSKIKLREREFSNTVMEIFMKEDGLKEKNVIKFYIMIAGYGFY
jgi:hypothetical protein